MVEVHPFEIYIPDSMQHLLLGSFTASSVTTDTGYDWYYGSRFTQFWKILQEVYGRKLDNTEAKKQLFSDIHLGVGDIILSCERKDNNSLDSNLINITYNPIVGDLLKRPLKTVYFSSRFVEMQFRKAQRDFVKNNTKIELVTLPSPSPRYATMSFKDKVQLYKRLMPKIT